MKLSGEYAKPPTAPQALAVYTLRPEGWWATWIPGLLVNVHADERVPDDVQDLLDGELWNGYAVPAGADGGDVREILERNGHRVESLDWLELPEDYWS